MRYLRFCARRLQGCLGSARRSEPSRAPSGACATPDSVAFRGNSRITDDDAAERRRDRAKDDDQRAGADVQGDQGPLRDEPVRRRHDVLRGASAASRSSSSIVRERPVLSDVKVVGPDKVSLNSVKDRVDLLIGKPIDPAQVAKDVARIDSLYQSEGYYLAKVHVDTIVTERGRRTARLPDRRGTPPGDLRRRDRRQQGAERQDDRRRDRARSPRVLLVAERRVRLRTSTPRISARRFRSSTRRTATSTCRS